MNLIVIISDGWGPVYGGINSFNYDFCLALGRIARDYGLKTVAITINANEIQRREAQVNNVELLNLLNKDELTAECILSRLVNYSSMRFEKIIFVGHDIKTGNVANKCRDLWRRELANGVIMSAIFHHMNYNAYHIFMDYDGDNSAKKVNEQRNTFLNADFGISVGPLLFSSLFYLTRGQNKNISTVIPGLASIEPIKEASPCKEILAIGRFSLSPDKDSIKLGKLVIETVKNLIRKELPNISNSDLKTTLIGYSYEENIVAALKKEISTMVKETHCRINLQFEHFNENRDQTFNRVRSASLFIMPSYHEGFGLTGLESISAGVPIILSTNSGLYMFLKEKHLEKYIVPIDIAGDLFDENGEIIPNSHDVDNLTMKIYSFFSNEQTYKKKAIKLREKLIAQGVSWEKCAMDFCHNIGLILESEDNRMLREAIDEELSMVKEEDLIGDYVGYINAKFLIKTQFDEFVNFSSIKKKLEFFNIFNVHGLNNIITDSIQTTIVSCIDNGKLILTLDNVVEYILAMYQFEQYFENLADSKVITAIDCVFFKAYFGEAKFKVLCKKCGVSAKICS